MENVGTWSTSLGLRSNSFAVSFLSRNGASNCLENYNLIGAFVIYGTSDGTIALSHYTKSREEPVQHYRIHVDRNGDVYLNSENPFSTLEKLIEYHRKHADVLDMPLGEAVEIEGHEIDPSELEMSGTIGWGVCGAVDLAKWGVYDVAVKKSNTPNWDQHLLNEIELMRKLKHKNIVTYYGHCYQPLFLVTEYMQYGDLKDHLYGRQSTLTEFDLVNICYQVCRGCKYLESVDLVHKDIHLRNILVGGRDPFIIVKLADFGHTKGPFATYHEREMQSYVRFLLNVFGIAADPCYQEQHSMPHDTDRENFPDFVDEVVYACVHRTSDRPTSFMVLEKHLRDGFLSYPNGLKMYNLIRDGEGH